MTETLIEFPKREAATRQNVVQDTTFRLPGTQVGPHSAAVKTGQAVQGSQALTIEIDKLYPATEGSASDLIRALGLLADAIELLEKARAAARDKEIVTSDRYTQRFKALLPDLFGCRRVGDGYGVIINSLHFALVNQHGEPLSFEHLTTAWRVLKGLRNRPFVSFDEAMESVGELEASNLKVDPVVLPELVGDSEDE